MVNLSRLWKYRKVQEDDTEVQEEAVVHRLSDIKSLTMSTFSFVSIFFLSPVQPLYCPYVQINHSIVLINFNF